MISADRARELAKRANFNLIDEQLRYLFEDIEEAANDGKREFAIDNSKCSNDSYSSYLWHLGPKINSSDWQKVETIIKERGFEIKFYSIRPDNEYVTIRW